jgi:cation transport regulator ChaC
MLTRRLQAPNRAPSAVAICIGYVEGRRLTFDKVSSDGSGKCDAEETGTRSDRVYGVVFEIPLKEKAALDKAEGQGYREETVQVRSALGVDWDAKTYIATIKEPILRPYHWYKALTIAGAVEHGLPGDYVEWLRAFESTEDPKADRRAENEALLFAS